MKPSYDDVVCRLGDRNSEEHLMMEELAIEHTLSIEQDFEQLIELVRNRLDEEEDEDYYEDLENMYYDQEY